MSLPCKPFIWLHIKKAGGQSMRAALGSHYIAVNRYERKTFQELPKEAWNDCLNNYRVSLGEYNYKRMLYAKTKLYSEEEFSSAYKFAVVRNPYDRALSCWHYLAGNRIRLAPSSLMRRFSFEYFLKSLPEIWESKEHRQLASHTAPVWPDVTDNEGNLLLDYVARLESIDQDIQKIFAVLGIPQQHFPHINRSNSRAGLRDQYTKATRALVEKYYASDIEKFEYDF